MQTGVWIVREISTRRPVALWGSVYVCQTQCGEKPYRAQMMIYHTRGIPVLFKKHRRSAFLTLRMLQRFKEETELDCSQLRLDQIEYKSLSLYEKPFLHLNKKERLQVCLWIAEDCGR
jgi:hypothetical protein